MFLFGRHRATARSGDGYSGNLARNEAEEHYKRLTKQSDRGGKNVQCYTSLVVRAWLLLPLFLAWPATGVLSVDGSGLSVEQCLEQFDVVFREIDEIANGTCSGDESCECMEAGAERVPSHQAWFSVARVCVTEHPDNPTLAELYTILEPALALEKEYYDSWDEFMTEKLGENWSCDM